MSGRVFTADYDRSDVARRVWIPLALAAILGMAGLLLVLPVVSVIAAMLTFLALRNWPLTRDNCPALRLDARGAEIDGLGFIPWRDIAGVNSGMVQVKALRLPALDLEFRRPLTEIIEPTRVTRLRPWEIRAFRLRRDGKIRLDFTRLSETPEDVQSAFRYFISGRD
jgi:hypothetical protein